MSFTIRVHAGLAQRFSRTLVLVAALFGAFPAKATHAQTTAAQASANEPKGYREAIDQAVTEFRLKNFEEARALFAHAHKLYPNARTLRGLGMVEFELRNYGMSVQHLEDALASNVRPLDDGLRKGTEKLLERATGFIARVAVDVRPSGATLLVDGVPVELGEGSTLTLQVGDHTIEVQAEKFKPEKRQLSVRGGENPRLTIVLKQDAVSSGARDEERHPLYKNPWLWTAVGVVVAGAAVGAAFLFQPDAKERAIPVTTANTPPDSTLQGLVKW